jgi:SPP1 family predicted phage head-tail adaptor
MLQSRIRRGELDRQIGLLEKAIGSNAFNEDKEIGWNYLDTEPTVWARVRQRQGRDMVIGDRLVNVQQTVFTIDYRDDINTRMRVIYRERIYEIISISENEDGRDRYLDLVGNLLDTESLNIVYTADMTTITADSTVITADSI